MADVSKLGNVRALSLYGCTGIASARGLGGPQQEDVNLGDCTALTSVEALAGVSRVSLYGCVKVRDVSALGAVADLNLARTAVEDVAALAAVAKLDLTACVGLTRVAALTGVRELDLTATPTVEDLPALAEGNGSLQSLTLRHWGETPVDVSAFTGLKEIVLNGSPRITGVEALKAAGVRVKGYARAGRGGGA